MIVKDEFIKKLRSAFDLNIYEAKIWAALLSKGIATAGELSDISDVPRSRSYDVLESLEKRGFVIMKLGKPIKYLAVQPTEVVKRVKKALVTKADTQVKMLENIEQTKLFTDLSLLFKNGISHIDPTNISGSIRGRTNIYDHMESMLSKAEKSVTISTTPSGLVRKAEAFNSLFKKLKTKDIKIKIATQITPENKDLIKNLSKYADVKNIPNLNARFISIDDKEVLFMVNPDKDIHESYDIGIWATSPFFVKALGTLFQSIWVKG